MQSSSSIDVLPSQQKFEANELPGLLEVIRSKYPNCEVLLQSQAAGKRRQRVIIFQQSDIAFCGARSGELDDFVDLLRVKINPDWIDRIFESSKGNLTEEMTARQFCERLLQMRVIQRTELFKTFLSAFLLSLEPFWAAKGSITIKPLPNQNNYVAMEWRIFKAAIEKRHKIWQKFEGLNYGINSIPIITEAGFKAIQDSHESGEKNDKVIHFIQESINGRSDIVDLAQKRNVDPLSLAQRIIKGVDAGWLSINDDVGNFQVKHRGNILVIDDNKTTRKLLVTILQEFYSTYATAGSLGCVSLIPTKKIDLIIVSHSVPTATSLQLCKVIRQNPDYQTMPFLMISSKENFFERAKAKMVGITEDLTQPLDRTKILYALEYYLR